MRSRTLDPADVSVAPLPEGFWFGGSLASCWKSVYDSFTPARLRKERSELAAARDRLAGAPRNRRAVEALQLRLALVERCLLGWRV